MNGNWAHYPYGKVLQSLMKIDYLPIVKKKEGPGKHNEILFNIQMNTCGKFFVVILLGPLVTTQMDWRQVEHRRIGALVQMITPKCCFLQRRKETETLQHA